MQCSPQATSFNIFSLFNPISLDTDPITGDIVLNKLKILKLVACGEHCIWGGEHSSHVAPPTGPSINEIVSIICPEFLLKRRQLAMLQWSLRTQKENCKRKWRN